MKTFEICYGLGGGFGGCGDWQEFDAENVEDAETEAYEAACETYYSYGGMHGLANREELAEEEPDWDDVDIEDEINEDMESWIDYEAREKEE